MQRASAAATVAAHAAPANREEKKAAGASAKGSARPSRARRGEADKAGEVEKEGAGSAASCAAGGEAREHLELVEIGGAAELASLKGSVRSGFLSPAELQDIVTAIDRGSLKEYRLFGTAAAGSEAMPAWMEALAEKLRPGRKPTGAYLHHEWDVTREPMLCSKASGGLPGMAGGDEEPAWMLVLEAVPRVVRLCLPHRPTPPTTGSSAGSLSFDLHVDVRLSPGDLWRIPPGVLRLGPSLRLIPEGKPAGRSKTAALARKTGTLLLMLGWGK